MMHDSGVLQDPKDPFSSFNFLPIKRMGTGPEVAELVAWLLCDKAKFITGTVSLIDGGWCC
jgi:3-oxoacyl-[acyl-carrier protein] reductase